VKKGSDRPRLVIDTPDGQQLDVVWSRSAKSVGVAITTALLRDYVQTGLDRGQVDDLVVFLGDPDGTSVEFPDPDSSRSLKAEWSSRRHRFQLTVSDDERGLQLALDLTPDDAHEFASFLRTSFATQRR
jgi:hypothetical protein